MLEVGKSVKENCEYLYNKGPEIVIFTFGEKGCAGISKEGFFEIDQNLRFTHKGFDLSNEFYIEII